MNNVQLTITNMFTLYHKQHSYKMDSNHNYLQLYSGYENRFVNKRFTQVLL